MHLQLQPQKGTLAIYIAAKDVLIAFHYYIPIRQSALVLKVGVSYGWKMTKRIANYSHRRLK